MVPDLDFELLARDWIRRVRGRRSQRALSRRLGYRSNVVYRWETGRAHPSAATVLSLMVRLGHDVGGALEAFYGEPRTWLGRHDPASREGVASMLDDLRDTKTIVALAAQSPFTRYQITRWLQSANEPRLHEWLAMVQVCSGRVLDLVAAFFGERSLPSVAPAWRRLRATRSAAYERPQSHLVLRALELEAYRRLPSHQPGWIARRVGLSEAQEAESLSLLSEAGQVAWRVGKWWTTDEPLVDTRTDQQRSRALRAFWLRRAADAVAGGKDGMFGYNLFSVSEADLERIRQAHYRFYREVQEIVRDSTPNQRVALFGTQLLPLDHDA